MMRNNRRRKYCRFTALGVTEIDYKDLDTLKSYISETGKKFPVEILEPNRAISANWRPR